MDGDRSGGVLHGAQEQPPQVVPAPDPRQHPQQPPQVLPQQAYPPQQPYPPQQGYPQGYPPQPYAPQQPLPPQQAYPQVGRPPQGPPGQPYPRPQQGDPFAQGLLGGVGTDPRLGGPGPRDLDLGDDRRGPSSRVWVVSLVAAVLVAVLAGGLWGLLRPSGPAVTTAPQPSTSSSDPAPSAGGPSAAPTSKAAPSASPSASATPRDTAYVQDPSSVAGMDFGIVTGIDKPGGVYRIRVDRAQFLTGPKAEAYYKAHPDAEPLDFAVVNTNPRQRIFTLTDDVVVYAQFALGDGTEVKTQTIDREQFYEKVVGLLATKQELLVWLRHTEEPDGPVWYVAEQYTP